MYVVTVEFRIQPGHADAFLAAVIANARTSVEHEPGCRQFDVCTVPGQPDTVFLYEVYDDRAAFDAHLATPHFLSFDHLATAWVAAKSVRTLHRVVAAA
jgi:quinol monooxygenase YgiN